MQGKTALLFAGQGAQYVGMGLKFAEVYGEARYWFEKADQLLGYELSKICWYGDEATLTRTEHAQPAIYLVSWIAFQLLLKLLPSLRWDYAAGLSLGELTALTAAGAFRFEDGLHLVRGRGLAMQQACNEREGAMAAVLGLGREQVQTICREFGIFAANYNCPGQIVVAGERSSLEQALAAFQKAGAKRVIMLQVAGAFHSPLMQRAAEALDKVLEQIPIQIPAIPVVSNVTARPHGAPSDIHRRLVQQVVSPVYWEDSIVYLLQHGVRTFIELGPGATLSGFVRRIDQTVCTVNIEDPATLSKALTVLTKAQQA